MIMNSPEPMSLGSPTQSPGVGSNGYMPNFLLGDITSSAQNMQVILTPTLLKQSFLSIKHLIKHVFYSF